MSGVQGNVRYRRVATSEDHARTAQENKKLRAEAADRIATKIQAMFWVGIAGLVAYHTDLPKTMVSGPDVARLWFNLAAVAFGINTMLAFYLIVWLPHVQKITLEWNVYCPRVIPTMTVTALTCGFCLIKALWPVWGLLTPLILGLVFMGLLMSLHFIPFPL